MCSTTLTLQSATITTGSLIRAAFDGICPPACESGKAKVRFLRMNWVVVTDTNGNRRLQMHWRATQ